MAQLVDALSWGGRQCEFDSHSEHQEIIAPVDKSGKVASLKRKSSASSTLARGTKFMPR